MIIKEQDTTDRLSTLMNKIQHYASKIVDDIKKASDIFKDSRISWGAITVPDIYDENADEVFYDCYFQDYVDLFDSVHSKDENIEVKYDRDGPLIYVSYGYFNSYDLDNYCINMNMCKSNLEIDLERK